MINIMVYLLLLTHMITCVIIFVSQFFEENLSVHIPTNLSSKNYREKIEIYITSFYLVLCCFMRVGLDSHTPDGALLILLIVIIAMFSPITFIFVLVENFALMFRKNFLRKIYFDKLNRLAFTLKKQDVSGAIVTKAVRYAQLLWLEHEGVLRPYLISIAPRKIKELISCGAYSFHLNNHFVFRNCHIDFKRQLCSAIDFDLYFPGDYITFKNTFNSTMYIIRKGEIEVLDEDSDFTETTVQILTACHTFGVLQGLHHNIPQQYSYRATRFSVIIFLRYDKWRHLLQYFPASREIIYNAIQDYL